jgi:hypothetical protein
MKHKTRVKIRAALNRPVKDIVAVRELASHLAIAYANAELPSKEMRAQFYQLCQSAWWFLGELRAARDILVPSPNLRLCRIHGIPIAPSRWLSGSKQSGCARCRNAHPSKKRNNRYRSARKSAARNKLYGSNRLSIEQILGAYPEARSMKLAEAMHWARRK